MRIGLLGPLEVIDDAGVVLRVEPDAARVLVAAAVADEASSEVPDGAGAAVDRLAAALAGRLQRTGEGYRLVLRAGDSLDSARFAELCAQSRTASLVQRREQLTEALSLWRGRALEELTQEPWVERVVTRLESLRVVALEDLAEALVDLDDAAQAVELLEPHVRANPRRERPVALMTRALVATGRTGEARERFDRFAEDVRAGGGEPTSWLRDLVSDLFGGLDPSRDETVVPFQSLPTGTVTFLFTDIEGSTQRWQQDGAAMSAALAAHDRVIRAAVEANGGSVFKHTGDGVCAVFSSAPAAVAAALAAQVELGLPVRMGVHTGEAELRAGDYFGPTLNRAARVMDAGHGEQVLVSSSTAGLLGGQALIDLGEHQLKGLETPERIFQAGSGEFPPLRTPRHTKGNLPADMSTFVGRSAEEKALAEALSQHRLVTLIGVGGTGKTRLAIETGATLASSFPDGCWLVDLVAVNVADAVPLAFAGGLGLTTSADDDVIDDLVARCRHKRMLVVVDNCEHVLTAAADPIERIIAGCPGVTVLATSREPLMVRGEWLMPLAPLVEDEAERLFLERARAEAPDLVIDDEQARAVAELCQRLDGLPLALELAASRVRAFTPVELVANLEERFRLLVGGRRSRMERHQTMRGTLDWSYDLCSDAERVVFDRLSVFPAGFDLSAARAVAAADGVSDLDVVDVVPQLLDRSLLQRSIGIDGTTRYRMLETMRAYGREHLRQDGSADVVRERYAQYVAALISALMRRILGPDEEQVARRLYELMPDAIVALDWFIDHREWALAKRVTWAGAYVSERESKELIYRLHDAARTGGAPRDILEQLEREDMRVRLAESTQDCVARGWRGLRSGTPVPTDRLEFPPHVDFSDGGLEGADVEEFVASLARWKSAPAAARFFAEWLAVRSLVHSDHLDAAEALLGELAEFVTTMGSNHATAGVLELRGTVARMQADWPGAARWYGQAVAANRHELKDWFTLLTTWYLLATTALCPEPFAPTGAQLRDPWTCLREEHITVLRWQGSAATAVALQRLGHPDLADRFVAWLRANDHIDVAAGFRHLLDPAGLPNRVVDDPGDLDDLVAELFLVADLLDAAG